MYIRKGSCLKLGVLLRTVCMKKTTINGVTAKTGEDFSPIAPSSDTYVFNSCYIY